MTHERRRNDTPNGSTERTEQRQAREARIAAGTCTYRDCPRQAREGHTTCNAHYSAGHNMTQERMAQEQRNQTSQILTEDADVEYADEDEAGQLALGVPGEQRAIPTLAAPLSGPLTEADHGREVTIGGSRFVVEAPFRRPAPRGEELGPWLDCCKARGRHRLDCPEYRPIGFVDERMPG